MTDNPMINSKLMDLLDIFAKQAFDKGMNCVKDNIDLTTGLWKESKKHIDMTEERQQAHDQIIELFRECLPKKKHPEMSDTYNIRDLDREYGYDEAITEAEKKIGGV